MAEYVKIDKILFFFFLFLRKYLFCGVLFLKADANY